MKHNKFFYSLLMLLCMCLGFTACSDDDDNAATNDLVGTWELKWIEGYDKEPGYEDSWNQAPDEPYRITFNEDGTLTGQSFENGKWQIEAAGTYSLNGDKLYTRSDYDRDGVATIVSKSSSKLVLESYEKDGDGEHYEKITLERVN